MRAHELRIGENAAVATRTDRHRQAQEIASSSYPSPAEGWYVIAILMIVTITSFLDRQLPALLVQPIRNEFHISVTQFSLLQGPAFAVLYSVMGIPFGRLIDIAHRRNIILCGLLLWSTMTLLCGFASDYWLLLLARSGVGIGEACLAPAAYSIIADYFAPLKRGRALAVYFVALAVGGGLSMAAGAAILDVIPADGATLPLAGHLPVWRIMFIAAALPGFPLALLMLTVREPPRLSNKGAALPLSAPPSVRECAAFILLHRAVFFRLFGVMALAGLVGYSVVAWAVVVISESFDLTISNAGTLLGACLMASGLCGALAGGFLSDRWQGKGVSGARLRVTALALLIMLPAGVAWPLLGDQVLCIGALALTLFGGAMATGSAPTAFQEIVPNRMRGQVIALYLLIAGLFGIGFGPTSVALVSDYLFNGEAGLPYALAAVEASAALLALALVLRAIAPYARLRAEVQKND